MSVRSGAFAGQVVAVTGGSRGIGLAAARGFAARGAQVVVASRKRDNCERVVAELAERWGTEGYAHAFNASDWDECDALVEAVNDRYGRIDVLINNAGLSPPYETLTGVSQELFDKVLNLNLRGPFRLSALVGTQMAAAEGGAIVNVGSMAASRPDPAALPYSAAKAGLNALTQGFAQAFAPRVRVNCLQLGRVRTDVAAGWSTEVDAKITNTVAMGRAADPDEIVGAIVHLASPEAASYTTGAIWDIDGGWR